METLKDSAIKAIKFRQSLFWDTDPAKIDPQKHARYIIERILEFGEDQEVRWMWNFYSKLLIKEIIERSRSLRPETKNLWNNLLLQK